MANMLQALSEGLKEFQFQAQKQLAANSVELACRRAEINGTSRAEAAVRAMGVGMATFVLPPVMIGHLVADNYKAQRRCEMKENNTTALAECLESHGISPAGAKEIARAIIWKLNFSSNYWISDADFRMWLALVSNNPSLGMYTNEIAKRHEWNRTPGGAPSAPSSSTSSPAT